MLHKRLIETTGGSMGIRDEELLDSALSSPFQSFDGKDLYPTIQAKAARLCYEVGTLRLTGFRQQVSGSRLPNRTYTSQRIRLSMNHLDSLVSCKSSKQSGQSARDFLRISNIFFSNISLPFSDFSVLTWCIHKYSACSPHISHFPALIRLIIVCLLSYFL